MIKKIVTYVSLAINLILVLVVILLSVKLSKKTTTNYTWQDKDNTTKVIEYINIGDVEKNFMYSTKAELDENYFVTYNFSNEDTLKVNVGDVLKVGDNLLVNKEALSTTFGYVEKIEKNTDEIVVTCSDFSHLYCQIKVSEEYAYEFSVGDSVSFNNTYSGNIVDQDYEIKDGTLTFYASFSASGVYKGTSLQASIIESKKTGVLRVSKEALIEENSKYYLNFLQSDGSILRKEIQIGLIGNNYVEIKSGVNKGEAVVILYE